MDSFLYSFLHYFLSLRMPDRHLWQLTGSRPHRYFTGCLSPQNILPASTSYSRGRRPDPHKNRFIPLSHAHQKIDFSAEPYWWVSFLNVAERNSECHRSETLKGNERFRKVSREKPFLTVLVNFRFERNPLQLKRTIKKNCFWRVSRLVCICIS